MTLNEKIKVENQLNQLKIRHLMNSVYHYTLSEYSTTLLTLTNPIDNNNNMNIYDQSALLAAAIHTATSAYIKDRKYYNMANFTDLLCPYTNQNILQLSNSFSNDNDNTNLLFDIKQINPYVTSSLLLNNDIYQYDHYRIITCRGNSMLQSINNLNHRILNYSKFPVPIPFPDKKIIPYDIEHENYQINHVTELSNNRYITSNVLQSLLKEYKKIIYRKSINHDSFIQNVNDDDLLEYKDHLHQLYDNYSAY